MVRVTIRGAGDVRFAEQGRLVGASQRAKGRRGQSEAISLLTARDWDCGDLSAGLSTEDILAIDTDGNSWSVEVKNCASINVRSFKKQAQEQAKKRRSARWMVLARVDGYSGSWLVLRQGFEPVVWHA